jgi:hypothetical protein
MWGFTDVTDAGGLADAAELTGLPIEHLGN